MDHLLPNWLRIAGYSSGAAAAHDGEEAERAPRLPAVQHPDRVREDWAADLPQHGHRDEGGGGGAGVIAGRVAVVVVPGS